MCINHVQGKEKTKDRIQIDSYPPSYSLSLNPTKQPKAIP